MYIITGGAGFIGSQLVRDLLAEGERVVVLDNFSTGQRSNLAGLDTERLATIETNIADGLWPGMSQVDPSWGKPKAIVHLAAQVAVVASVANPLDDVRLNYATTMHVLEYARFSGAPRIVFASSAATYGNLDTVPLTEEMARWPVSPYGINKFGSEMCLRYYAEVHGVPTASLRFFNVYGPRQDPSNPYSGVISIFMQRALDGERITIFGDGEQTRDFVYVGDVSQAIRRAASEDFGGDVFNVGTSTETTVNQLAQTIARQCNSTSEILHAPARKGEILRSSANISAAREKLGFDPKMSLESGLQHTLDWFRSTR